MLLKQPLVATRASQIVRTFWQLSKHQQSSNIREHFVRCVQNFIYKQKEEVKTSA